MNTRQNMIIANEKIITSDVLFCSYNSNNHKYAIKFKTGKIYSYSKYNLKWLNEPEILKPLNYRIMHNQKELYDITEIYVFCDGINRYWHLYFKNGTEKDYAEISLTIYKSSLNDKLSKNIFNYLKKTAEIVSIHAEDGTSLLSKQYEKIDFVGKDKAFSTYVNPNLHSAKKIKSFPPIFPFGCNASQFKAVKNALENQISVIQGPPGTGKTQTILNIIANLLISGKTIQVVSNNNSATKNILEKLSYSEYHMGFFVAALGNSENKKRFIQEQENIYPDIIKSWNSDILDRNEYFRDVSNRSEELNEIFQKQEQLALARQALQELEIEYKHFKKYSDEVGIDYHKIKICKNIETEKILQIWKEFQNYSDIGKKLSFFFKLKCRFIYGISKWSLYNNNILEIITLLQSLFYIKRREELIQKIRDLKDDLNAENINKKISDLKTLSMQYLKAILYKKYGKKSERRVFTEEDLWKNPADVQKEYPVILSTTFSARCSLCRNAEYDYLIMDEASQVDVATGALALSCANNAVIVGDSKQLPNVVTSENKARLQAVFNSFDISKNYNFKVS